MASVSYPYMGSTMSIADINEEGRKNYEEEQKRKLNSLFANNIDNAGNLSPAFYKQAAAAGLSPDRIAQAQKYYQGQVDMQADIISKESGMRGQGVDPLAAGRNTSNIDDDSTPAIGADIGKTPASSNSADTSETPWYEQSWDKIKSLFGSNTDNSGNDEANQQLAQYPTTPAQKSYGDMSMSERAQDKADFEKNYTGDPAVLDMAYAQHVNDIMKQNGDTTQAPQQANTPAQAPTQDESQFAHDAKGNVVTDNEGNPLLKADNTAKVDLGEGTVNGQAPMQAPPGPDNRTFWQRTEDTYQDPNKQAIQLPYKSDFSDVYDIANTKTADSVKMSQAAADSLGKLGKTPDQAGVASILGLAAGNVPKPRAHYTADGNFDLEATKADQNGYLPKVNENVLKARDAIVTGNTQALGEIIGQKNYDQMIKEYNQIKKPQADREAALYGLKADVFNNLQKKGFVVDEQNAGEVQKAAADVEETKGTIKTANQLIRDIKKNPNMNKDLLNTRANTVILKILASEKAGTEGAQDQILATMGAPLSTRQQIAQMKAVGNFEGAQNATAQLLQGWATKNGPVQYANLLSETVQALKDNGAAVQRARSYQRDPDNYHPYDSGAEAEARQVMNKGKTGKTGSAKAPARSGWYKDADGVMRKH